MISIPSLEVDQDFYMKCFAPIMNYLLYYLSLQKDCAELFCSPLRKLEDEVCELLYTDIAGVAYILQPVCILLEIKRCF